MVRRDASRTHDRARLGRVQQREGAHRRGRVDNAVIAAGSLAVVALLAGITLLGRPSEPEPTASDRAASSAAGSPSAFAEPSAPVIADDVCAMERAPGADDAPVPTETRDGFAPEDWTIGRWRLCLDAPEAVVVEASAWCQWDPGRGAVVSVAGLNAADRLNGPGWTATVQTTDAAVTISEGAGTAAVDAWSAGVLANLPVDLRHGGRTGALTVRAATVTHDGRDVDPPAPPIAEGTIRWACGDPPPPKAGLSTGHVAIHLDAPINADREAIATCNWVTVDGRPALAFVETAPITLGDRSFFVNVGPNTGRPAASNVAITVSMGGDSADYGLTMPVISYRLAPDGGSGLFRLPWLERTSPAPPDIAPGGGRASATVSWSCEPPARPGRAEDADPEDAIEVGGVATLDAQPALGPIRIPVTCRFSNEQPRLIGIDGRFDLAGGGGVLVRSDGDSIVLGLVAGDGGPAGEYVGPLGQTSDVPAEGALGYRSSSTAFVPTDPRYVPIGGPAGPRTLDVRIELACDLAGARLPGLSFGRLDLTLGSGIDRAWSVALVCSWERDANGRVTVDQAVNFEPLTIDVDEGFRAYARPDLRLVVERFGTLYQPGPGSDVVGSATDDGSTGELTFHGVATRGRVTNINGRLGGRDGPLAVDGSIHWSCGARPARIPDAVPVP